MPTPRRGAVWLIDFGFAGKTRPALVVSVAFGDQDRSLIAVVPHTTSLRGSPFEMTVPVPFLKPGAFLVQGVTTFPTVKALHRLRTLQSPAFDRVFDGRLHWLGHMGYRLGGGTRGTGLGGRCQVSGAIVARTSGFEVRGSYCAI